MSAPASAPALSAPSLPVAVAALRAQGLRISAARRLVIEALFAADGPVTAEQIASGFDGRLTTSDLASVYRNLETLEAIGLVCHVHLGHGPGRYALGGLERREHLICDRCGTSRSVAPATLDAVREAVREAVGYEARFSHFPLVGLCPDCADEVDEERPASQPDGDPPGASPPRIRRRTT